MTAPAIDINAADQLLAALTPACEIVYGHVCPIHNIMHNENDCDRPAEWIVRVTCTCGAGHTVLACDPHSNRRDDWICSYCGLVDAVASYTKELIRHG